MFDTPEANKVRNRILPWALAGWLVCLVLGFWTIERAIDLVLSIYAAFAMTGSNTVSKAYWGGTALRSFTAIILGSAELAVAVGLAEFIFRNAGLRDVWAPIARVISVEIALIVLSYIL